MPLESAADFTSYVDTTAHGVSATLFEVQNSLFDSFGLIDSLFDIDSGNSTNINIIIDQEYLGISGGSVDVSGFQPTAFIKASDAPFISHRDILKVDAITTNQGSTLSPATTFNVVRVEPDNVGMVQVFLEKQ
tara:strand:+ start:444 stop:842 length:399 start_codon:yes stop_codon:yes gene_type:complete